MSAELAAVGVEPSRDARLQASRRLDWRFLLPQPELGTVAYVGPTEGSLWRALELLVPAVTTIKIGEHAPGAHLAASNLVINCGLDASSLTWAVGLLQPGGWLYCEGHGRGAFQGRRRGDLRTPLAVERLLAQLGIEEVASYWHWPSFDHCTMILPLAPGPALHHGLVGRHAGGGAGLRALLGAALLGLGLPRRLAPCFSVVALRPSGGRS
jgi:hypothetical protein